MNGMNNGAAPVNGQPMGQPMMSAQPKMAGVFVPMTIPTPMGEVTVQPYFPDAQPNDVPQLVMQLIQSGWPVKAYAPKPQGGFGNGGGGGGYQGGYNNGGGYGGGYRPRRW